MEGFKFIIWKPNHAESAHLSLWLAYSCAVLLHAHRGPELPTGGPRLYVGWCLSTREPDPAVPFHDQHLCSCVDGAMSRGGHGEEKTPATPAAVLTTARTPASLALLCKREAPLAWVGGGVVAGTPHLAPDIQRDFLLHGL